MADIPAGTGLGSSGSFTTALLKALHAYQKNLVHPRELAEQACHIEIDLLNEPIGKQDQYIAAFGGLTCFQFLPNGQVEASPLKIDAETLYNLEDNLLLFFTGYSRSASAILKEQDDKSRQSDRDDDRQPSLREGAGLPEQGGAGGRRPAAVRRADEGPLGAQEKRSGGMTNPTSTTGTTSPWRTARSAAN